MKSSFFSTGPTNTSNSMWRGQTHLIPCGGVRGEVKLLLLNVTFLKFHKTSQQHTMGKDDINTNQETESHKTILFHGDTTVQIQTQRG